MSDHHDCDRAQSEGPLASLFADDASMVDLILFFIDELPNRVAAIEQAFASGECNQVKRLAHQLKGAAGGYGYPEVTMQSAALEQAAAAGEPELSALAEQIESLSQLCQRVQQARPGDRAA